MTKRPHYRFYIRPDRSEAKSPVYLQVTYGERRSLSLGITGPAKRWNAETEIFVNAHDTQKANAALANIRARLEYYFAGLEVNNEVYRYETMKAFVLGAAMGGIVRLGALITEYLTHHTVSYAREQHFAVLLGHVKEFAKQDPPIVSINYRFMISLATFLKTVHRNHTNTVAHKLRMVKTLVHFAQKAGYVKTDETALYRIKESPTAPRHLLPVEVTRLRNALQGIGLTESEKNVLRYFLFCCQTGLRFGDVQQLTGQQIRENCIELVQSKTRHISQRKNLIPLTPEALALMPAAELPTDRIFRVVPNSKTNLALKAIAKKVGVNPGLSFHYARHTFGTMLANAGVRIEIVSALMGHKSLKTTQVYADLNKATKKEAIQTISE